MLVGCLLFFLFFPGSFHTRLMPLKTFFPESPINLLTPLFNTCQISWLAHMIEFVRMYVFLGCIFPFALYSCCFVPFSLLSDPTPMDLSSSRMPSLLTKRRSSVNLLPFQSSCPLLFRLPVAYMPPPHSKNEFFLSISLASFLELSPPLLPATWSGWTP